MQETQSNILTQADLAAELERLGHGEISKRTIEEWRRKGLLPEFGRKGAGLGRGVGRQPSGWVNGRAVVTQAGWVSYLLAVYGRIEDVYLPLWLLGFPMSLRQVRKALKQPVERMNQSLREEMRGKKDVGLEDFFDDVVAKAYRNFQKSGWRGAYLSAEEITAAWNVLFNPEYDLNDEPFQSAVASFQAREARKGVLPPAPDDNSMGNPFQFAPFVKDHFSFEKMKDVVRRCTDEELRIIERDIGIMREIIHHGARMIKALLSAALPEFLEGFPDSWHALFTVGHMFVLADLALRRGGHGAWIDQALPVALEQVRAFCTAEREAELKTASPQMMVALQAGMDTWMRQMMADNAAAFERGME